MPNGPRVSGLTNLNVGNAFPLLCRREILNNLVAGSRVRLLNISLAHLGWKQAHFLTRKAGISQ